MALTQKMLKAMGIEDDQREQILDAHQEVLESIKSERDALKEKAAKVDDLQRQLEEAKAASNDTDEWKSKYEAEHKAYEDYKGQIAAEKAKASKADAYRKMLTEIGVAPNRIDAIMKVTDLSGVEIGEDGTMKDFDSHKDAAAKEWADFIVKQRREPDPPAAPPKSKPTIEGADPEIAKHLQQRHAHLFGTTEEKE